MTLPEATYLAWIDFSGSGLEGNPSEIFRERGKITVHDGAKFCASAASCVRVNFATSPEILDLVIDRMANVLQEATS